MSEPVRVYAEPITVKGRLYQLGLTPEDLRQSLQFGYRQAAQCTENDAPTAFGFIAWDKTTRALRDVLLPKGWMRSNSRGYATVIEPAGGFAIAVAGGDERTGNEALTPSNRTPKGTATKDAVSANQLSFLDYNPDAFGPLPQAEQEPPPKQTWTLLHRLDRSTGLIVAELSLATDISVRGFVGGWRERIVLGDFPFGADAASVDGAPPSGSGSDTGAIDIPISRKVAN